jgi:integrase
MTVLEELRPLTGGSEWVLASPSARAKGRPIGKTHKAAERLREKTKLKGFTGHDLRRTAATGMARLRVEPRVVGKVLNHSDHNITEKVYLWHDYLQEKRRALEKWGRHLEGLVTGRKQSAKVVALQR